MAAVMARPKVELAEYARPFLDWLDEWHAGLQPQRLEDIVRDPSHIAMASVDVINAFTYEGNLASPRVAAIIQPIVKLLKALSERQVRQMILVQECHSEDAEEFKAFAPHGICGTSEAEMVPEFRALPFAKDFHVIHKNSLHTVTGTKFENWLAQHPQVNTFIIVGDCTDLCVYDLAMDLKLRANQVDLPRRVIVPANCVDTYDLPVETAKELGAMPHDGNLQHVLFLYMMALNKIEVVREIV